MILLREVLNDSFNMRLIMQNKKISYKRYKTALLRLKIPVITKTWNSGVLQHPLVPPQSRHCDTLTAAPPPPPPYTTVIFLTRRFRHAIVVRDDTDLSAHPVYARRRFFHPRDDIIIKIPEMISDGGGGGNEITSSDRTRDARVSHTARGNQKTVKKPPVRISRPRVPAIPAQKVFHYVSGRERGRRRPRSRSNASF